MLLKIPISRNFKFQIFVIYFLLGMFLVNWTMRALMGNLIKLGKFDLIATRWWCEDDDSDSDYDIKQQALFCVKQDAIHRVRTLTTPKGINCKYSERKIQTDEIIAIKRSQIQMLKIFPKQIARWRFCINFPLLQAEYFNKQWNF